MPTTALDPTPPPLLAGRRAARWSIADGRVLVAQRPAGKPMAGLWEFPGGKLAPARRPEACLIRELHEELGVDTETSCLAPLTFASHAYAGFHLLMPLYVCRVWRGQPAPREGQVLRWLRPECTARPGDASRRPAVDPGAGGAAVAVGSSGNLRPIYGSEVRPCHACRSACLPPRSHCCPWLPAPPMHRPRTRCWPCMARWRRRCTAMR